MRVCAAVFVEMGMHARRASRGGAAQLVNASDAVAAALAQIRVQVNPALPIIVPFGV